MMEGKEERGLGKEQKKGQMTVALVKALLSALKKRTVVGDVGQWKCNYVLEKRVGDIDACKNVDERLAFLRTEPYEKLEGEDNCLLNSGINEIWDLVTGVVSGASHIFDNTHAQIGVGDSSAAANATQTDLQAAVNKTYKGMEATFPTSTTQKATFKSSFGSSEANYEWNEWVVKQSTSTKCINRKVDAMGTKASGSTWTLEVTITLS
ncbi:MAG: hypothetical protein U9N01_04550 [Euryarchaeota archaeon]|nr:hypothetical protein [Euryarchaeota archaeon]